MSEETAITKYLSKPQELVEYIRATGDFDTGFDYVRIVYEVVSKFDATLDVVLKGMEDMWIPQEHAGRTFYEEAIKMTLLSPATIQRHTKVGRMLDGVPDNVRPRIESMDFKSKIQLVPVIEDGYKVTEEQWDRIAGSFSYQDVGEVVREIKNVEPRSQWCRFIDDGSEIWVNTSQGSFIYARREKYENEEISELMDWVHKKAIRKLEARPK